MKKIMLFVVLTSSICSLEAFIQRVLVPGQRLDGREVLDVTTFLTDSFYTADEGKYFFVALNENFVKQTNRYAVNDLQKLESAVDAKMDLLAQQEEQAKKVQAEQQARMEREAQRERERKAAQEKQELEKRLEQERQEAEKAQRRKELDELNAMQKEEGDQRYVMAQQTRMRQEQEKYEKHQAEERERIEQARLAEEKRMKAAQEAEAVFKAQQEESKRIKRESSGMEQADEESRQFESERKIALQAEQERMQEEKRLEAARLEAEKKHRDLQQNALDQLSKYEQLFKKMVTADNQRILTDEEVELFSAAYTNFIQDMNAEHKNEFIRLWRLLLQKISSHKSAYESIKKIWLGHNDIMRPNLKTIGLLKILQDVDQLDIAYIAQDVNLVSRNIAIIDRIFASISAGNEILAGKITFSLFKMLRKTYSLRENLLPGTFIAYDSTIDQVRILEVNVDALMTAWQRVLQHIYLFLYIDGNNIPAFSDVAEEKKEVLSSLATRLEKYKKIAAKQAEEEKRHQDNLARIREDARREKLERERQQAQKEAARVEAERARLAKIQEEKAAQEVAIVKKKKEEHEKAEAYKVLCDAKKQQVVDAHTDKEFESITTLSFLKPLVEQAVELHASLKYEKDSVDASIRSLLMAYKDKIDVLKQPYIQIFDNLRHLEKQSEKKEGYWNSSLLAMYFRLRFKKGYDSLQNKLSQLRSLINRLITSDGVIGSNLSIWKLTSQFPDYDLYFLILPSSIINEYVVKFVYENEFLKKLVYQLLESSLKRKSFITDQTRLNILEQFNSNKQNSFITIPDFKDQILNFITTYYDRVIALAQKKNSKVLPAIDLFEYTLQNFDALTALIDASVSEADRAAIAQAVSEEMITELQETKTV